MAQEWDAANKAQALEYLFELVANGMSFTAALGLPLMPSRATFAKWRAESEVLQARYVRAREALADYLADEVVSIADQAVDSDSAAAARVRVDARRWVAGKYNTAYSDSAALLASGGGGGLTIVLNRYEPPRVVPSSGHGPEALPAPGVNVASGNDPA